MQKRKRAPTRQPQALAMLVKDHRMVQKMFREFDKLEDSEDRRELVKRTCQELRVHTRMEEAAFYPAIRRAFAEKGREPDLVAAAEVEHGVARNLIAELERMAGTDDEHFDAAFRVLGEYVNHHIEQEEGPLFREIARVKLDLGHLADDLRRQKESLHEEMGIEEAGEEEGGAYGEEKERHDSRRRT